MNRSDEASDSDVELQLVAKLKSRLNWEINQPSSFEGDSEQPEAPSSATLKTFDDFMAFNPDRHYDPNDLDKWWDDKDPLGSLLMYHLIPKKYNKTLFSKTVLCNFIFSIGVSGGTVVLYVDASIRFATIDSAGTGEAAKILKIALFSLSTLGTNFFVQLYPSLLSFAAVFQRLPLNVREKIDEAYGANKKWVFARMLSGLVLSALTGVTLAMVPEKAPAWKRVLIFGSNTLSNFYTLYCLLFEHIREVKNKSLSCFSLQEQYYQELLASFNHTINTAKYRLIEDINNNNADIPEQLEHPKAYSINEMMEFFADMIRKYKVTAAPPSSCSKTSLEWGASLLGMALISAVYIYPIKFYENVENEGNKLLEPVLPLAVLVFVYIYLTFGSRMLQRILDTAVSGQLPLAMQLYFKTSIISMAAAVALVSCSWAAALDFALHDDYIKQKVKWLQDVPYLIAMSAAFSNAFPLLQIVLRGIEFLTRIYGPKPKQISAALGILIANFLDAVNNEMSPQQFLKSLEQRSADDLIALCPKRSPGMHNVNEMIKIARGNPPKDNRSQHIFSEMEIDSEDPGALQKLLGELKNKNITINARKLNEQPSNNRYNYLYNLGYGTMPKAQQKGGVWSYIQDLLCGSNSNATSAVELRNPGSERGFSGPAVTGEADKGDITIQPITGKGNWWSCKGKDWSCCGGADVPLLPPDDNDKDEGCISTFLKCCFGYGDNAVGLLDLRDVPAVTDIYAPPGSSVN